MNGGKVIEMSGTVNEVQTLVCAGTTDGDTAGGATEMEIGPNIEDDDTEMFGGGRIEGEMIGGSVIEIRGGGGKVDETDTFRGDGEGDCEMGAGGLCRQQAQVSTATRKSRHPTQTPRPHSPQPCRFLVSQGLARERAHSRRKRRDAVPRTERRATGHADGVPGQFSTYRLDYRSRRRSTQHRQQHQQQEVKEDMQIHPSKKREKKGV